MASVTATTEDTPLAALLTALKRYQADHPRAIVQGYRQGPYSVSIRVIDPDFAGVDREKRHDLIWRYLDSLPDEILDHVGLLVPVTPREAKTWGSSRVFETDAPPRPQPARRKRKP